MTEEIITKQKNNIKIAKNHFTKMQKTSQNQKQAFRGICQFLTLDETNNLSQCNKSLYKILDQGELGQDTYFKRCLRNFIDLEYQQEMFYIDNDDLIENKINRNKNWKEIFIQSEKIFTNFKNYLRQQNLSEQKCKTFINKLKEEMKQPQLPVSQLRKSHIGIEVSTIFQNFLIDHKQKRQTSFKKERFIKKTIIEIFRNIKLNSSDQLNQQDVDIIKKMRFYQEIGNYTGTNQSISKIVKFYSYLKKLITMKCDITRTLLEEQEGKVLLHDYIEKWQVYSCFINNLFNQFNQFDSMVQRLYQQVNKGDKIQTSFSIWRLATKTWIQKILLESTLIKRMGNVFKLVLKQAREQSFERFLNQTNNQQLKLKNQLSRKPYTQLLEQDEDSFNLIKTFIKAFEDVSLNEVSVHQKIIDSAVYEKPYVTMLNIYKSNLVRHYQEKFEIFQNFYSDLFMKYIKTEERLVQQLVGFQNFKEIQKSFDFIRKDFIKHKMNTQFQKTNLKSIDKNLESSLKLSRDVNYLINKNKNIDILSQMQNFTNEWMQTLKKEQSQQNKSIQMEIEGMEEQKQLNKYLLQKSQSTQYFAQKMTNLLLNNFLEEIESFIKIAQEKAQLDRQIKQKNEYYNRVFNELKVIKPCNLPTLQQQHLTFIEFEQYQMNKTLFIV